MKKAQIGIEDENSYNAVKRIMAVNSKPNHSRHLVINEALRIAAECVNSLDEESLESVTKLKKSI